uniref:Uncharacterized protein n=1 Tax=Vespula pensylvanica TaxID=30213 RepID=A0A834U4W1_VESPE|nr:hypothetical protein H0235_011143 [Vespula pensylvanica]
MGTPAVELVFSTRNNSQQAQITTTATEEHEQLPEYIGHKYTHSNWTDKNRIISRGKKILAKVTSKGVATAFSFGRPTTTAILDDDEHSEPSRGSVTEGLVILANAVPS